MLDFYFDSEILSKSSCVDIPQQNDRVERRHRHALNVTKALCFQENFSIKLSRENVLTVAYFINETPTGLLKGKTTSKMLFHHEPSYDFI